MLISTPMRVVGLALLLTAVAGCSKDKPIYEHENFDDSGTYSRNYPVADVASCEAARRALLSQGYIITSSDPKLVSGHKSFQQTGETHLEISFNVVCAEDGSAKHHATVFAKPLLGADEEAVLKALRTHTAYLQREVARRVNLKFAPDIRFKVDDSFDNSAKIDALLRSGRAGDVHLLLAGDLDPEMEAWLAAEPSSSNRPGCDKITSRSPDDTTSQVLRWLMARA